MTVFLSYQPADNNNFGVAFRYIDPFNYYAVEFRKNPNFIGGTKGYKRIIKVSDGNYSVLAEEQDGGFLTDTWYHMALVAKGPEFKLYVKEEQKGVKFTYDPNALELILTGYDSKLSQGTVAILNNGNQGLILDQLLFQGSECI